MNNGRMKKILSKKINWKKEIQFEKIEKMVIIKERVRQ